MNQTWRMWIQFGIKSRRNLKNSDCKLDILLLTQFFITFFFFWKLAFHIIAWCARSRKIGRLGRVRWIFLFSFLYISGELDPKKQTWRIERVTKLFSQRDTCRSKSFRNSFRSWHNCYENCYVIVCRSKIFDHHTEEKKESCLAIHLHTCKPGSHNFRKRNERLVLKFEGRSEFEIFRKFR